MQPIYVASPSEDEILASADYAFSPIRTSPKRTLTGNESI